MSAICLSESLSMIREILTTMFAGHRGEKKKKVCFTVPAPPLGAEGSLTYHEATVRQILTDLNYEPTSINEGLAIVYSELEIDENDLAFRTIMLILQTCRPLYWPQSADEQERMVDEIKRRITTTIVSQMTEEIHI